MSEPREFEDLEAALRQMAPRTPSAGLDRRVRRLARRHRVPVWLAVAGSMAAGFALAVLALRGPDKPEQPVAAPAVRHERMPEPARNMQTQTSGAQLARWPAQPARIERVWFADQDNGIVGERNNEPVRRLRRGILRDVILLDPAGQRVLRVTVPQQETVIQATEPY